MLCGMEADNVFFFFCFPYPMEKEQCERSPFSEIAASMDVTIVYLPYSVGSIHCGGIMALSTDPPAI